MYRLRLLDEAAHALSELDASVVERIAKKLRFLAENATAIQHRSLRGQLAGFYKLRVGDYRVVYKVLRDEELVLIVAIGHRSTIYRDIE